MLGPSPKTGCGLGALVTSPFPTSICSWQSCSLTHDSCPQPWGPRDTPHRPWNSPCPDLMATAGSAHQPSLEKSSSEQMHLPVESGKWQRWQGEPWSRGSPALCPALDIAGPDTGDSAISGAHPPSQIVPAWEEVSLMLPRAGGTWPHSWPNLRSGAGLRLAHTWSPSQTPHPGPLDCGTTSHVHHT